MPSLLNGQGGALSVTGEVPKDEVYGSRTLLQLSAALRPLQRRKFRKKGKKQIFFKKKRNFFKISLAFLAFTPYISYWKFILEEKHSCLTIKRHKS